MSRKRMVIVGAGLSGLTAGAYLLRNGHEVMILEKTPKSGGLVGSFGKDGFLFDAGPRAFGNAGILVPMLEDLGITLPLVNSPVSTGIGKEIVHYDGSTSVRNFTASLARLFPAASEDIRRIEKLIQTYCSFAKTMNSMPNPFFKDPLKDFRFLFREFLPWLPSFLAVQMRTALDRRSVEEVLDSATDNASLRDMVSQHFFKGTPAGFALGYFDNFLDYLYPPGGTGELPRVLEAKIVSGGGTIRMNREVMRVFPLERKVQDQDGEAYPYDSLLWAADLRSLYQRLEGSAFNPAVREAIGKEARSCLSAQPGESVFTLFLGLDADPAYFEGISRGHFIYTPRTEGLGDLHRGRLEEMKRGFPSIAKETFFRWLGDFCARNSYEISFPVLRDRTLAPPGKTGMVVSLLFDGQLCVLIEQAGWMEEFRERTKEHILDALEGSLYPGLRERILFALSATPLTLNRMFRTSNGAITGWSLESPAPVPDSLAGIMSAVRTSIPHVHKCGQWSYSPSGVPVAILTGRIAALAMDK